MTCQSCPVCHGRLQRTQEEIAQHIEECVRKVGKLHFVDANNEWFLVDKLRGILFFGSRTVIFV